jgi:hypothetical protein
VYLAGEIIAFAPRLSVLKLLSAPFRAYAATGEPPQQRYMAQLHDAPERLERQVLFDLSLILAQHGPGRPEPTVRRAGGDLVRAMSRHVNRHYPGLYPVEIMVRTILDLVGYSSLWPADAIERAGEYDWPMAAYLRWNLQRRLRAGRVRRGLPARKPWAARKA